MDRKEFIAHLVLRGFKEVAEHKWDRGFSGIRLRYIRVQFFTYKTHVIVARHWGWIQKTGRQSREIDAFRQHDDALQYVVQLFEEQTDGP